MVRQAEMRSEKRGTASARGWAGWHAAFPSTGHRALTRARAIHGALDAACHPSHPLGYIEEGRGKKRWKRCGNVSGAAKLQHRMPVCVTAPGSKASDPSGAMKGRAAAVSRQARHGWRAPESGQHGLSREKRYPRRSTRPARRGASSLVTVSTRPITLGSTQHAARTTQPPIRRFRLPRHAHATSCSSLQ